ncbi:acyl-CoA dehydrogenase family protein [Sporichthya polymorpha]|uniref:acyl-CoA dehydrogenase family protein n=1 Tax=Sporichthya polymorpha TaxID=35751 RepID=UPI000378EFAD|nr:acyl-CoA dehydrogenase family protein [Sporichthya polymorpha]
MTYPWADDETLALMDMARKFFLTESVPHREKAEANKHVDRELWRKAGSVGLLCAGISEEYGGGGGTLAHEFAILTAQASTGDTGFGNSVHTGICAHYIDAYGTEEQKQRWLPGMASGDLVAAIAMTEPGCGSDLKALRTTAIQDGDEYVLNGSKTFITNGGQADLVIVVCKTDPAAPGVSGVSLVVVETQDQPGYSVGRLLDKMGMHASDTAELFFDNVRVPVTNLLGQAGRGFHQTMQQLPQERLILAVIGVAVMEAALAETVEHTKNREAFGGTLFDLQNTRFVLAECATLAKVARTFVDDCVVKHCRGELDNSTASMAKWWVTETQGQVVDKCQQLFGGYGFMWEYPITRMAADGRVQRIYGGANELMKELIARSL